MLSSKLGLVLKGLNLSIGDALADFHAKTAETQSVKVVAHVDEVYSASKKNYPLIPDFCHSDVLAPWQQPASKSKKQ